MAEWLLEVTDLKQYTYCPRIVFYRYCLPTIRPLTFLMEEGIRLHQVEEEREERRSLQRYQVEEGERFPQLSIQSHELGLSGCIDLVIATPSRTAANAEAIVVEYKYSEQRAGSHFKLQLAAYALLVEEAWQLPVRHGFIYSLPLKRAERIPITPALRKKTRQSLDNIRATIEHQIMPDPPTTQARCVSCEFRRFCNDVV